MVIPRCMVGIIVWQIFLKLLRSSKKKYVWCICMKLCIRRDLWKSTRGVHRLWLKLENEVYKVAKFIRLADKKFLKELKFLKDKLVELGVEPL